MNEFFREGCGNIKQGCSYRGKHMYNQDEFIFTEFKKNYKDKKEPIAIYGIGVDAGKLVPKIPEYNIVGLMDGKQKSGEIYGKAIIDYKEALERNVKKIIIVARPAVLGVIYHRIADFACRNHIFVGDVRGRNLAEEYRTRENDIPYFHKGWKDLRRACEKHDIVTFDIFDTLIVRKTMQPKDIFRVVETAYAKAGWAFQGFTGVRIEAEDHCYKKGMNPTIYQIYDEIENITDCDKEVLKRYMEKEINTEKQFLCARNSMLQFFNSLKEEKEIYLISDMYLPSDILDEILQDCGYSGYRAIYVSCEHGCSKNEGLFETFISEGKGRQNALHIGDNENADGKSAENAGMASFLVMNQMEMLENSSYSSLVDKAETILDRISIGLFCNRAFDDPFVLYETKGKLKIKDHRNMAYLFIAPEILYFSCWLIQNIRRAGCDYIIYPSRDAFVLQKICSGIRKNQRIEGFPEGEYIYVSRRALYAATAFGKNDIDYIVSHDYRGTTLGLFKDRFNLDLPEKVEGFDRNEALELAGKYAASILDKCREERENYLHYLKLTGINQRKKAAFIDFVAAGTIQNGLRKILDNDIQGFYFLKRNTDDIDRENSIQVVSFYPPKGDFELDANIYRFYLFFELMLTSPEPTLNYIGKDLKPVFLQEKRSREEIDMVMEMQEEMIQFAMEVSKLHPDIFYECIEKNVPDMIVGFMGKEYSDIVCEAVMSMVLTDEYLARTFNIFDH